MKFQDDNEALKVLKLHVDNTPDWVILARDQKEEAEALIYGENYIEFLVNEIEHLESKAKRKVRAKYSRPVTDLFVRIGRLLDNIFSASGTIKNINGLNDTEKERLEKHLSQIKGGMSLGQWMEDVWIKTLHVDANGITYLKYDTDLGIDPYPEYIPIDRIRYYLSDGRSVDYIVFEPKSIIVDGKDTGNKKWTIVDDVSIYVFIQEKDSFTLDSKSDHLFDNVPVIINSNDKDFETELRYSPYDPIFPTSKTYGSKLSVLDSYDRLQGFPKSWALTSACSSCGGRKLNDEGGECGACHGSGESGNDVANEVRIRLPDTNNGEALINGANIGGFISPDLAYITKAEESLDRLENSMFFTQWGNQSSSEAVRTATETIIDEQPTEQRLGWYASQVETVEAMIVDLTANQMFTRNATDEKVSIIIYSRDFIIASLNAVTVEYQTSKTAGDNAVILDDKFSKVLLTTYQNNKKGLDIANKKAHIEPYIHLTIEQVLEVYKSKQAQKKGLFNQWYSLLTPVKLEKDVETLREDYNTWFEDWLTVNEEPEEIEETNTNT